MDQESTSQSDVDVVFVLLFFVLLIFAFCIWIVLSFTQQRTHKWPGYCWGLPGVVDPVNFLNPTHRIVAALAFGGMSSQFIGFIYLTNSVVETDNAYANVFLKFLVIILEVLLVALLYYPFFACVDAPISLVGYCMGSLYCDLYMVYIFYTLILATIQSRNTAGPVLITFHYINLIPQLTCTGTVLVWFHYKMVRELIFICSMGQFWKLALLEKRESESPYHLYVKKLLSKHKERSWPYMRGFKYPFPFLIVMVLGVLIVYQLTVTFAVTFVHLAGVVADYFDSVNWSVIAAPIRKTYIVFIISPILSAGVVTTLLIHLAYIMRKHIKDIYSGTKHLVVDIHLVKWPSLTLVSAIRYAGSQITAVIIAWFIFWIVFSIIGLVFVALSFFPDYTGRIIYTIFMTVLFAAAIYGAQLLITWVFFISDESNANNSIVIGNRRVFNCFTYIVLLYNILTGLVSTVLRLLIAIGITCLMLVRMDQPLVLKGWGRLDFGHKMYKNFMTMELLLGNPVMHVFIHLLLEAKKRNTTIGTIAEYRKSKKAYNRWMVAYTLVRNTQLQTLTASYLRTKHEFNDSDTHATMDAGSNLSSVEYKACDNPYTTYPGVIDLLDPINFAKPD